LTVAVAVATAGSARTPSLLRCVQAILAGDRAPERLLIVDQGGSEDLGRLLAAVERPAGTVVERIPQARLGLSASRNLALDRLRQDVVAVTDDDCVPDPGWLDAICAAFAQSAELAVVTGPVLPLPAEGARLEAVSSREYSAARTFGRWTPPWHVGTGGNMAFRPALLDPLRFDERLGAGSSGLAGEDIDLLARALSSGRLIAFEPASVVRHERQTRERRRASRFDYGHGVGAALAFAIRRGDLAGPLDLGGWILLRLRLAIRRRAPSEELRMLHGTLAGLAYGLRRG
jgi:GT2 family glycosyltransferase